MSGNKNAIKTLRMACIIVWSLSNECKQSYFNYYYIAIDITCRLFCTIISRCGWFFICLSVVASPSSSLHTRIFIHMRTHCWSRNARQCLNDRLHHHQQHSYTLTLTKLGIVTLFYKFASTSLPLDSLMILPQAIMLNLICHITHLACYQKFECFLWNSLAAPKLAN